MASYDQYSRTPMASRRVRRHAMGVSNLPSHEDNASSSSRSTVSLIQADKVIKVSPRDRPVEPFARETRVEDRPTVNRVHDKLFKTHGERYVHKVLRSYCPDGSGLLSPDQLRSALDRLHVGLDPRDRDRIVARVAPEPSSRVHYLDLLRSLEAPQPLGGEQVAAARGLSVPGPPTVRPGGGGSGVGDGGKSYWNWQRYPLERIPGLLDEVREGTREQAQSDSLLTSLLAAKLAQYPDKMRIVFRQMDANRNSLIDREEFAKGLAKLRIHVSRPQVDRLFELVDTDRSGTIDYEEFVNRFEEHGLSQQNTDQTKERLRSGAASGTPLLSQTLGLSHDEVAGAVRHPLVLELARSLYGKGSGATTLFQRQDLPRVGQLDLGAMTLVCQALVPGISQRQVAALMTSLDADTTGHVDYRAFVERLTNEGALAHPRLAHSAPPGGKAAAATRGALARFGEPLTEPEAVPTQHTRALSAVSFSRHLDSPSSNRPADHFAAASTAPSGSPPALLNGGLPPATTVAASARSGLHDLHDIAIAPVVESLVRTSGGGGEGGGGGADGLPTVSRSVDIGALAHAGQQQREGGLAGRTEGGASGIRAPSHASGRFSRFWTQRYGDTSCITSADPSSSLYASSEGIFVTKGQNGTFLEYQAVDREREVKRRQQQTQRFAARSEIESRHSAVDDASGADEGRIAVARAMKQKYEERCEMYDRLRQRENQGDHAFFSRLPVFLEHKSDAANGSNRAYW